MTKTTTLERPAEPGIGPPAHPRQGGLQDAALQVERGRGRCCAWQRIEQAAHHLRGGIAPRLPCETVGGGQHTHLPGRKCREIPGGDGGPLGLRLRLQLRL